MLVCYNRSKWSLFASSFQDCEKPSDRSMSDFLKWIFTTLNSLHYSSNQQHLLRPGYPFVAGGVGDRGLRCAKETADTSNYYWKHQINISWLLWDPFWWASGGEGGRVGCMLVYVYVLLLHQARCMSLWMYENWKCLILAYIYDGEGHDRVPDIPTFSIPSSTKNPLHMYLSHQRYSVPQKIVFQLVLWANSSHILLIFLLVLILMI